MAAIFLSVRLMSTRLPRKALADVGGRTLTERLIDRLGRSRRAERIVLCTSERAEDEALVALAGRAGALSFRGSERDKLERYLGAAREHGVDSFVVVDGDDLFCDPDEIDRVIEAQREGGADYVTVEGLPLGAASFGVRTEALEQVCLIKDDLDTEVWGGYFTETGLFRSQALAAPPALRRPEIRLTIDYPEDLELARRIHSRLGAGDRAYGLAEIVALFDAEPALGRLNAGVQAAYESIIASKGRVRLRPDHRELLARRAAARGARA